MSGSLGEIDERSIWQRLMALAAITEPDRPYTRRSFTSTFERGRDHLRAEMEQAGLRVSIDAAGNLIGQAGPQDVAPIMLGSHSDTVPEGGRFDGALGVVAAIEVARVLIADGWTDTNAIAIVDFLAEEPSDYGLSCVGSRGMVGALSPSDLSRSGPGGETLGSAIGRMGGQPARLLAGVPLNLAPAASIELHIEQGHVLEEARVPIGIVSSIVGIARIEVTIEGRSDHSGTTPMHMRQDALVAAAQLVQWISARAGETRPNEGYLVATIGRLEISPNAANAVPGRTRMTVEIRSDQDRLLECFHGDLDQYLARAFGAFLVRAEPVSHTQPVLMDDELSALAAAVCADAGLTSMSLPSGAGHDSGFLARIAPTAMIFIPSRNGRSHTPEEWSEPGHVATGARVLLDTVRRWAERINGINERYSGSNQGSVPLRS